MKPYLARNRVVGTGTREDCGYRQRNAWRGVESPPTIGRMSTAESSSIRRPPADTLLDPAATSPPATPSPIEQCTVAPPLRPAEEFSYDDPPEKTNSVSYAVTVGRRRVPFKFLRAGSKRRPVLVFLHGMGLTTASYWGMLPYTLRTHDLLLMDWSDFATGDYWPRHGMPLPQLSADVVAVTAALNMDRFILAGSSLGGGLSLMAAIDHPQRVSGLILFNPAAYPQRLPGFYKLSRVPLIGEFAMRILPADRLTQAVFRTGYADPRRAHPDLIKAYESAMRPLANRLKLMHLIRALPTRPAQLAHYTQIADRIRQPTLVIWGQRDGLVDGSTPHRLKQDIKGLRLELLPDISHLPHEEAPETVGPLVGEFLADIGSR